MVFGSCDEKMLRKWEGKFWGTTPGYQLFELKRYSHKADLDGISTSGNHDLQNRTKINPKILEMVSEYEYAVMMFMMLCTSIYIQTKKKIPQVQACMEFYR